VIILLDSVRITAYLGLACVRINDTLLYKYVSHHTRVYNVAFVLFTVARDDVQTQIFSVTSANGVNRRQDLGQNGIEDMIQLT